MAVEQIGVIMHKLWAARVVIAHHHVTCNRHKQGEGHVGSGVIHKAGRVAHRDAARFGIVQIHMIHAHAEVADHAQVGHEIHLCAANRGMAVGQKGVGARQQRGRSVRPARLQLRRHHRSSPSSDRAVGYRSKQAGPMGCSFGVKWEMLIRRFRRIPEILKSGDILQAARLNHYNEYHTDSRCANNSKISHKFPSLFDGTDRCPLDPLLHSLLLDSPNRRIDRWAKPIYDL